MISASEVQPQSLIHTGAFVDAGSGHSSLICYSHTSSSSGSAGTLHQLAKDSIKNASGGNLPLTDVLASGTPESFAEFIDQLRGILDSLHESGFQPTLLYVGATGGLRQAIEKDIISSADVQAFRSALESAFSDYHAIREVKLVVLDGTQEATFETDAAQIIWGLHSASMFPLPNQGKQAGASERSIGIFSGGGQSMQLGRVGEKPLSFNFSTFYEEFEEKQGAHPDAWLDSAVWGRFEDGLHARIKEEAKRQGSLFTGDFVCTAMNHRAAMYCQFAEKPIRCDEAIKLLKSALPQFRDRKGQLFSDMMASATGGSARSSYPLARITASHTFRLCATLEHLFSPDAQLFFARNGTASGDPIECEWTLGAFKDSIRKKDCC